MTRLTGVLVASSLLWLGATCGANAQNLGCGSIRPLPSLAIPQATSHFVLPPVGPPTLNSEAYEALIERVSASLQAGSGAAALELAQSALRGDSSRFEGYYFVAYILYNRQNYDQALAYANAAVARATPDGASQAEELVTLVTGKINFQAAAAAMQQGQMGIAAERFAMAWEGGRSYYDAGFSAVDIFLQLKDYGRANGILTELESAAAAAKDPKVADRASNARAPISSDATKALLDQLSRADMFAQQQQYYDALMGYRRAEGFGIPNPKPYLSGASIYALCGDLANAEEVLRRAAIARVNLNLESMPVFLNLIANPSFASFVQDTFGSAKLDDLRYAAREYLGKMQAAADLRNRRAEAARQEYLKSAQAVADLQNKIKGLQGQISGLQQPYADVKEYDGKDCSGDTVDDLAAVFTLGLSAFVSSAEIDSCNEKAGRAQNIRRDIENYRGEIKQSEDEIERHRGEMQGYQRQINELTQ